MRLLVPFVLSILFACSAWAQDVVPQHRYVMTPDVDFFGADRANLFDTTLDACERACSADRACVAFTFNTRSQACFPKSGVNAREPYVGALSATKILTPSGTIAGAVERAAQLEATDDDRDAALRLARAIGARYPVGAETVQELTVAANAAWERGDQRGALRFSGMAVALSDAPDGWLRYARFALRLGNDVPSDLRRRARTEAMPAALNAFLRAETLPAQTVSLTELARAYEANGRGRDMIAPLRLAQTLQPTERGEARLADAIAKYGFRITDHRVDSDNARPRVCATFSEPLIQAGFDYDPYVNTGAAQLVSAAEGTQLCLDGVTHGTRVQVTFRAGLPAASGETLVRDVKLALYVRDRAPSVRFPGRSYVLGRGGDVALPVETVNLTEVALTLSKVSDRNLVRALRENLFGRPLTRWEEETFRDSVGDEVWRGTGQVQGTLNVESRTRLPLDAALADQPAGVYVLTARPPEADPYDVASATQWFVLTDLGVTTWQGNDGLTAAIRSLRDAGAVEGAEVTLISRANAVLGQSTTDGEGFVTFPAGLTRGRAGAQPAMLQVSKGDDFVFLPLTDPAFDLSDRGVAGRAPAPPVDVFVTTDRGAYRPSATIHLTALVRDATARGVPGLPVTAILRRPDGVEYARQLSDADRAGGHVFALPLGQDVPRGAWRIEIKSDLSAAPLATQTVLVEDFVPERIDVALALPEQALTLGESARVGVQADYLFGAPGADLRVEGELQLERSDTLPDWPGYRFGRYDAAVSPRQSFFASVRTGEDGAAQLPLTWPQIEADGVLLTATATVRVSDGAGRPVERQITRAVAPSGPVIGIKPAFDDVLPEGAEARFDLITLGADMPVTWAINRVETRYQWYQLYGSWNWEPITRRTRIASGEAVLGQTPVTVAAPTEWGSYEIVVESREGRYTASAFGFAAGWHGTQDRSATPDRLAVALDAPAYAVGDTPTLRLNAPFAGTALISVLASDVIERRAVPVLAGENVVTLEVTEAWGSGAYIAASVLRGDTTDSFGPSRALGIVHAAIDPADKALSVTLSAAPETSGQAGTSAVQVRVDGLNGAQGYVTLAAVDVGILNLTGFDSPDPAAHYFGQRRLGVGLRDLYGRLIDGQSGALGTVRSGGDANAGLSRQAPPPTEAVMAFFSGAVPLDAQGRATIPVKRPDFNGTIRLMAVAWSEDGVGAAQTEMLARDPVVISAAVPRFLAPGDRSRVALDFVHAAGPPGAMEAQISAPALGLTPQTVLLEISDGATARISLPLTAQDIGEHSIDVALTTPDGARLTKTLALGVRAGDPVTAQTRRLTLAAGQSLTLDDNLLAGLQPASAIATVAAGPLARFDMPGLLRQLDRYPYGCTEQVTSAALPLLYAADLATGLGLRDIDARINSAIARVLTRQASNGAFGLWRAQSGEFWLDAYVTDFLVQARDRGFAVPETAMALALDNLRNRVNYAADFETGGEDLAYALLVLARAGAAHIGDLRYYADAKGAAFGTALARAQLGAALAQYGEQARADTMFGLAQDLALSETEGPSWRSDFGTELRDAAGLLHLAAEAGSTRVDQTRLSAAISNRERSLSTQEAAYVVMAASALGSPGGAALFDLEGIPVAGPVMHSYDASDPAARLRNLSGQDQEVTVTRFGVPLVAPEPGGYGYAITRQSFDLEGAPASGPWAIGERRVIVLEVQPFEKVGARLMVDDPLPAGLEIDNPNLLRAGDVAALDWLQPAEATHAEFRSDRFLAAVDYRGDAPFRLAYIARAVSPGSFHHPAALVEDMYRPEYRAVSATGRMTVAE